MNDPEAQSGLKWIYQSIRTIKNIVSDINDQGLKFIIRLQSSRLNSKPLFHSRNGSTRLDRKIYPSNDIGKNRILWKKIFSFRIPNSVPSDRLIKLDQKLSKIVVSIHVKWSGDVRRVPRRIREKCFLLEMVLHGQLGLMDG